MCAGFWKRFLAFFIDHVILFAYALLCVIILNLLLFTPLPAWGMTAAAVILLLGGLLYYPLAESSKYQATFGKNVAGITVTDMHGKRISFLRALARNAAKFISYILFIGFIMSAFTKRKQALHDIIAGCMVTAGEYKHGQVCKTEKPHKAIYALLGSFAGLFILFLLALITIEAFPSGKHRDEYNLMRSAGTVLGIATQSESIYYIKNGKYAHAKDLKMDFWSPAPDTQDSGSFENFDYSLTLGADEKSYKLEITRRDSSNKYKMSVSNENPKVTCMPDAQAAPKTTMLCNRYNRNID
ncbi:putative RDD family membrane protein YckC [Elusimicrobium posterum]|uniref:RDD family protein n=1 Tax=Elusimicrobium posterum TaxID=3116653 RepID=UPI003C78411A